MKATDVRLFYRFDAERGADPVGRDAVVSFSFGGLFVLVVEADIAYRDDEVAARTRIGGVVVRAGGTVGDLRPLNTTPLDLPPGEKQWRITTTAVGATPPPGTVTRVPLQVVLLVEGVEVGRSAPFRVVEAPNIP